MTTPQVKVSLPESYQPTREAIQDNVAIVADSISHIRDSIGVSEPSDAEKSMAQADITSLGWSSAATTRAFLNKFRSTGDVEDLASAQMFARTIGETRKDGEINKNTIGKKWNRLFAVNLTMKNNFGVIDEQDVVKLRTVAELLDSSDLHDERVSDVTSQWSKASRYVALAELTDTEEDKSAALAEVHTMVDGIMESKRHGRVGEIPFTVSALYKLGEVEQARELVTQYLSAEHTQSHYIFEALEEAAKQTQDAIELELALEVIHKTLVGREDGHSKGLLTNYGTRLASSASNAGEQEIAKQSAELIYNPQRRDHILGTIAVVSA